MKKAQRRVLGAMLQLCDNNMEVNASVTDIAMNAGYKAVGGTITYALEFLEYHNKIIKLGGEHQWRITI